jgi:hypothetical protein
MGSNHVAATRVMYQDMWNSSEPRVAADSARRCHEAMPAPHRAVKPEECQLKLLRSKVAAGGRGRDAIAC